MKLSKRLNYNISLNKINNVFKYRKKYSIFDENFNFLFKPTKYLLNIHNFLDFAKIDNQENYQVFLNDKLVDIKINENCLIEKYNWKYYSFKYFSNNFIRNDNRQQIQNGLFLIKVNKKIYLYNLINFTIELKFDSIKSLNTSQYTNFNENLFLIRIKNKGAIINDIGQLISNFIYKDIYKEYFYKILVDLNNNHHLIRYDKLKNISQNDLIIKNKFYIKILSRYRLKYYLTIKNSKNDNFNLIIMENDKIIKETEHLYESIKIINRHLYKSKVYFLVKDINGYYGLLDDNFNIIKDIKYNDYKKINKKHYLLFNEELEHISFL